MGITAKNRASLCLTGTTAMTPDQVMQTLTDAVASVRGVGKITDHAFASLWTIGAHVEIARRSNTEIELVMNSGKNLIEICTFRARATPDGSGRTRVVIGGLDSYKTTQEKYIGLIPVGPKLITGMAQYKHFLDSLSKLFAQRDNSVQLMIAQAA